MKIFKLVVKKDFVSVSSAMIYFRNNLGSFNCLDYFKSNHSEYASILGTHPRLVFSLLPLVGNEFSDYRLFCILRVTFVGRIKDSFDYIRLVSSVYVYRDGKN